ncbi:group I truncated hemoglobin [Halorubrum vacuolatum]|uniref:Hemoglobin n=1 Tax=Halorubrum vacuolatum TaxID=63740 RepID=A0A238WM37_HALVU|nr:group 1 truncated hemoglobin [Halorubrum vacuolatum]SNR46759.1 hemoglobin [Halorubrum vacuolatum]
MSETTLYDRLGGKEAIGAVVTEFYDRVLADDTLAPYFEDTDMTKQRAHQTQFISSVAGGPVQYDGDDMQSAHAGMGITHEDYDAIASHLDAALAEFDVADADREAVLEAVESYREAIVEVE